MNKKFQWLPKIVYGVLVLFLILGTWLLLRKKPVRVETAKVVRGHFEETLRIDGTIKSKTKLTVTAYATGDLGRVDLKVGDTIQKGQTITVLTWDIRKNIASPMDGVVSKVYRESAGPVQRGEPIIDIIDPKDLEIEAEVLTTDAVRIPEGALVNVTGLGNEETLKAKVHRISKAGFVKLSALGIEEEKTEVYMHFTTPPKSPIGDNYHVELFISLFQDDNVLKIPLGALFKNQDQWAVYINDNKKAYLRQVRVGKKNDFEALISEGLKEGEEVILFPGDQVTEGTKITPY